VVKCTDGGEEFKEREEWVCVVKYANGRKELKEREKSVESYKERERVVCGKVYKGQGREREMIAVVQRERDDCVW